METKYFSLGTTESNSLIKIIKVLFGVVCFSVALFWIIFNIRSIRTDWTLWITIIFLTGFGFYQIWSGLGKANIFIEFGSDFIRLKKNPVLPPVKIIAHEFEKIELYPLNVIYYLKSKKRIMLRFGTTFNDINEKVKNEILDFAERNGITLEIIEEKL